MYVYIFILALLVTATIIGRRYLIVKRSDAKEFKEEVAERVKRNRELQKTEESGRFKEEHLRTKDDKKYDIARFKEEMRQADMAIARKNFADAKKYLIQAMSLAKEEVPVGLKLAKVYLESGDLKRSEALYRKLIEEDPENPDIYESIGRIMLRKKSYKDAVQAYCRAVELDSKDDQKFLALGKLYHLMMRYGVAAECFKRAAELKPREVTYLFLLADSCAADDDYENALFTYERILTIEPYNEKAKSKAQDVRLKIKEQESVFK